MSWAERAGFGDVLVGWSTGESANLRGPKCCWRMEVIALATSPLAIDDLRFRDRALRDRLSAQIFRAAAGRHIADVPASPSLAHDSRKC